MKPLQKCGCLLLWLWLYASSANAEMPELSLSELVENDFSKQLIRQQVRTSGIVTWINPYAQDFVLTSETDPRGIQVKLRDKEQIRGLQIGDRLEIQGKLSFWRGGANFKEASYEKIGTGKLPTPSPMPIALDLAKAEELCGQRLTVEGKVAFLIRYFDRYGFWIEGYGLPIYAEFREAELNTQALDYAGAVVRIMGVANQNLLKNTEPSKLILVVNSVADIEVLEPAPKWAADESGYGINGVMVCQKSDNRYFFRTYSREIQDLELYENRFLKVGDLVRYVGTKVGNKVVVAGVETQDTSTDWALGAETVLKKYAEASRTGDWVVVQGVTSSNLTDELEEKWFSLTNQAGKTFRVEVGSLQGDLETLQLSTAVRVEVRGYLEVDAEGDTIYPRSFDDFKVDQRRKWYQSTHVQLLGTAFLAVLATSLFGVFFLRTLVNRRTQALEESTGLLNSSYDAILEGICLVDTEGAIQKANPHFWQLLSIKPEAVQSLRGDALRDYLANCFRQPEKFIKLWDEANRERSTHQGQLFEQKIGPAEHLSLSTFTAYTQGSGKGLGRVWVFHDLTEQRRLEQSLVQAQKMEAVGRLAGGVAHDFNNMLTGISGNLKLAKLKLPPQPSESLPYLEATEYGVERATKLVKGLLGFSRQSNLAVKPGSVNDVVKTLLGLLKPTLNPKISLETDLAPDLGWAQIDAVKLEQVLLNLVMNARDAMLPAGGTIRIQTRNARVAEKPGQAAIECVEVTVTDTGSGMPAAVVANVFEPFFSTKPPGQGTGLGLATSLGVVQQLQGWITCESELGQGTVFRVQLPRVSATSTPCNEELPASRVELTKAEISMHVLCVDDEAYVRNSLEALLQSMGYQTTSAENGQHALQVLMAMRTAKEKLPDVVLLDHSMPVLTGEETLPLLRAQYPDLPVILCSGFMTDLEQFAIRAGSRPDGFLQKPYEGNLQQTLEQIVATVVVA